MTPLFGAELRAQRAREHLRYLRKQIENFQRAHVRYIGTAPGPDGEPMLGLVNVDQRRMARLSIKAGEIIYNLRSGLDYSINELSRDPKTGATNRWAQFPIETKRHKFNQRVTGRDNTGKYNAVAHHLKGVPPSAVKIIRSLQPPPLGQCLWTKDLQTLSNADKHNHLFPLRSKADIRLGKREVISVDAETGKGSVRIYYDAEVHEVAFEDGRPVTDTLEGLCAEVVETIALLKSCMKRS